MIKVIFHELRLRTRFVILKERVVVLQGFGAIIQLPYIIRVDDHMPCAIQIRRLPRLTIGDQRRDLRGGWKADKRRKPDCCQESLEFAHRSPHSTTLSKAVIDKLTRIVGASWYFSLRILRR